MVVVSREEYGLYHPEAVKRGWNKRKGWYLVVKYTSTDDFFYVDLPDYIQSVVGKRMVRSDTRKGAIEAFKKAVREYEIRVLSKRKIILYLFRANVKGEVNGEPYEKYTLSLYHQQRELSSALNLWWTVCYETGLPEHTNAKENTLYYNLDGSKLDLPYTSREDRIAIDWTEDREAFFRSFSQQLAELVYKADGFLNKTDDLLKLIDSGNLLPWFKEE